MALCPTCDKTINDSSPILDEVIDDNHYIFDSDDCLTIFRRIQSVYGKEFMVEY